mgnify:CR=1 FL=1
MSATSPSNLLRMHQKVPTVLDLKKKFPLHPQSPWDTIPFHHHFISQGFFSVYCPRSSNLGSEEMKNTKNERSARWAETRVEAILLQKSILQAALAGHCRPKPLAERESTLHPRDERPGPEEDQACTECKQIPTQHRSNIFRSVSSIEIMVDFQSNSIIDIIFMV